MAIFTLPEVVLQSEEFSAFVDMVLKVHLGGIFLTMFLAGAAGVCLGLYFKDHLEEIGMDEIVAISIERRGDLDTVDVRGLSAVAARRFIEEIPMSSLHQVHQEYVDGEIAEAELEAELDAVFEV